MSDQEKAKGLSLHFARQYHHNTYPEYNNNGEFVFSNEEIEIACNKMAEWKNDVFREIMKGVREIFEKYTSNAAFTRDNIVDVFKELEKQI